MIMFGAVFKELRQSKNKSQKEMAEIFNISQAAVSNWEAGRKIPEVHTLITIAKFFEVSIDYLLGLED